MDDGLKIVHCVHLLSDHHLFLMIFIFFKYRFIKSYRYSDFKNSQSIHPYWRLMRENGRNGSHEQRWASGLSGARVELQYKTGFLDPRRFVQKVKRRRSVCISVCWGGSVGVCVYIMLPGSIFVILSARLELQASLRDQEWWVGSQRKAELRRDCLLGIRSQCCIPFLNPFSSGFTNSSWQWEKGKRPPKTRPERKWHSVSLK